MKIKLLLMSLTLAQEFYSQASDSTYFINKLNQNRLEISELSTQVQYYKNILKSSKAIRTATFEHIQFDINQVSGSRKDGSITLGFTYKNLADPRRILQCEKAVLVDLQGQQFQTTNVYLAPNKVVVNDVLKDVPYRGGIFYNKVNSYFPTIRALILYVYPSDQISNPMPVVFENVPVVWE